MYTSALSVCMPVHQKGALSRESPCGCWELNSGHLENSHALLSAESSLQLCHFLNKKFQDLFIFNCMCVSAETRE